VNAVLDFIIGFLSERGVLVDRESAAGMYYREEGIIDSFEVLNLFMSLEEEFGVKVSPKDMLNDSLKTVDGLAAFIAERM
jgi:acyl carrier protein